MKNKLYNCDFRDVLPELEFDLVASDPPYNIKFGRYATYSDDMLDSEYINMIAEFKGVPSALIHYPEESMKYFVPALGIPDEVLVWCYNSNIPRQSRLVNIFNAKVNFDAVKQPYKNPKDKRIRKLIENGSKGTRSYDWFSDIQLVKNVSNEKHHPCPVPVKLMERIILMTTNIGDTIFDPFMGSGTTGVACINTGRDFIGCEIDEKYFEIAKERIMDND